MTLIVQPAVFVIRTSTSLTAGGADVLVDISPVTDVSSVMVVSCPSDAQMRFGGSGAPKIPITASDSPRNNLALGGLVASSVTGGTLVLEVHGR